MEKFVILFRQGLPALSEAEKSRRQQEVSAWARRQNAAGHRLEPRILGPESVYAADHETSEKSDSSAGYPVTALLFVEAVDLAEAANIARSHPALHFRASIEVRPWAAPVVPPVP